MIREESKSEINYNFIKELKEIKNFLSRNKKQIIAITRTLYIISNINLKFLFLNLSIMAYFLVFIVWFYFSFHIYMHVPYKFIEIG